MRRALVISLLFHLLVLAGMFEFRLLPSYSAPFVRGATPLAVDIHSLPAQRELAPDRQGQAAIIASVKADVAVTRASSSATEMRVHRRVLGQSLSPPEPQPVSDLPREDGPTALPADVESEYRLNIARELRKAGYFPQRRDGKTPGGVVHLFISYRAGLPMPMVSLSRSSGRAEVDASAMTGLNSVLARVPLPPMMTGASFKMSFVLDYGTFR